MLAPGAVSIEDDRRLAEQTDIQCLRPLSTEAVTANVTAWLRANADDV